MALWSYAKIFSSNLGTRVRTNFYKKFRKGDNGEDDAIEENQVTSDKEKRVHLTAHSANSSLNNTFPVRNFSTADQEIKTQEIFDSLIRKNLPSDAFRLEIQNLGILKRGVPIGLKRAVWGKLLKIDDNCKMSVDLTSSKLDQVDLNQIKVDVNRTAVESGIDLISCLTDNGNLSIDECKMAEANRNNLEDLLISFAISHPTISYCQGMSDIGAFVLKYFDLPSGIKFFTRVIADEKSHGESIFDTKLSQTKKIMRKQREFIRRVDYKLYKLIYLSDSANTNTYPSYANVLGEPGSFSGILNNLSEYQLTPVDFVFLRWLMTYFTRNTHIRDRVWDYLVFYGFDVLFYFTTAILKYHEQEIRSDCDSSTDEVIVSLNNLETLYIEPNTLITIVEEYMRMN